MAPKFEGNLAHALPQNDTETGRTSGVALKKDRPREVDAADFEPDADHVDLSQDDLEVDDGFESLKDEDLKVDTVAELEAEKAAIEAQSKKRLKSIEIGSRANAAANAKAFEERAQPMREIARQMGQEAGRQEQARLNESIEWELERSKDGQISGFKNIPMIGWNAFRRGMAGRMEAIKNETIHLLGVLRDDIDNDRLKALEAESNELMQMYREGKVKEDEGANAADIYLSNHFYRQIHAPASEGLTKTHAETIQVSSDVELANEASMLRDSVKGIDKALYSSNIELDNLESNYLDKATGEVDFEKQAQDRVGYAEVLQGMRDYQLERKKGIESHIVHLRELQAPENLDIRSKRLNMLKKRAEEKVPLIQEAMKKTHEKESIESASEVIDDLESRIIEYQKDLLEWQKSPVREMAMESRRQELEQEIQKLQFEASYMPPELSTGVIEEIRRTAGEMKDTIPQKRERLAVLRREIPRLLKKKAELSAQRLAILAELQKRDEQNFPKDIDLTELNQWVKEPEIDVDTSAFDEPDVDLTDLNERVEGYKDIDIDTSDFEEKPKKVSRVKKALNAIKKKAA